MKRLSNDLIIGKKFGRLTPIEELETKKGVRRFKCKCECGNECEKRLGTLIRGLELQSCGCMLSEALAISGRKRYTHGMTNTIFWKKWAGMKRRCYNKNENAYKDYGGRGISVCDKWLKFEGFYGDMYNSYIEYSKNNSQNNTTLDRINVNGNYELGNCRRATQKQQSNNRRSNHFITIDGETKTQQQRADNVGKNHKSVFYRIRHGIDIFDENKHNESQIEYEGKTQSISARAKEFGMETNTLGCRLRRGIPMEEAINKKDRRTVLFTRGGKTQTLTEWYTEKGLTKGQFEHRLYKKKLPIEKILNLT